MAINGVSVNNANEEHINYDNLENRIASAEYSQATNVLTFRDEEGTQKFNVEVEQDVLELDDTLSREGYAADAKAVGDEITRVESAIPNVDSTLSTTGDAADAGATGALIVNAMNQVAEGFNDAMDAYLIENAYGQMYVDENNGLHISAVTPDSETVITDAVDAWLDDHPEATTTVRDGSITNAKLSSNLQTLVAKINPNRGVASNPCYPMVADKYVITDTSYAHGQGMCFIDSDVFVQATVTGTEGDDAKLYVINSSTNTVLSTNLLPVSHANSLTYNSDNGKIYIASRGHIFVVGINASTYVLTVEDDLSFDTFFQGVAYYDSHYYLYGDNFIWKSADLQTLEKLFPIDGLGYTFQGLCVKDGGIYLCAAGNVNNIIWQYSFDGYLIQIRTLPVPLYFELEELDIVDGAFWSSCVDVGNGKIYIRRVDTDINLRKDLNSVRTTVNGNNLNKLSYKVVEDLDAEFAGEGIHLGMYRYNATSVPRGNAGMVLTGIWSSNYAVQVAFDTQGYVYIRYKSSGTISAWSMMQKASS